jgi:hypothetical protein
LEERVPIVESQLSTVSLLAQRLLWNRTVSELPRRLPVVVLLGPVGAGKTHALGSVSRDCDAGVVHAGFNFDRDGPDDNRHRAPGTVEVLAQIAFNLSREWKARPNTEFTRFTLGMIAVQTPLNGLTRGRAKEELRAAIDNFARNRRAEAVAGGVVGTLADVAKQVDLIGDSVAETIKNTLPRLIRTVARKPLGEAKRWHSDIPQAEGSEPIDALISLSQLARGDAQEMTDWLTAAFLADVRESYLRMAPVDSRSPCACANPQKLRHWHNWVLLLDNIDHGSGERFIADLLAARERHLDRHSSDHDPILVIATSGRWNRTWEGEWRVPWIAAPAGLDRVRAVPRCRMASYEHWIGDTAAERPPAQYYPVLLEPLNIDETAQILAVSRYSSGCDLVQRATGGLPAAVRSVAPLLHNRSLPAGARDILWSSGPDGSNVDPWRTRLDVAGLIRNHSDGEPHIDVDEFISAAPFATAPWLVPAEATSIVSHPHLGRILTELRTCLWVTAPAHSGATPDYGELHPWIARTLVTALAQRKPSSDCPSYETQFTALLNDPETVRDPTRRAYCQLALGQISEVVSEFEFSFDRHSHRTWTDQLRLVIRAPDNQPLGKSCAELYRELVDGDVNQKLNRTAVRNIIARLLVASWLAANPFAVSDPRQKDEISNAYRDLRPLSRRPDVGELHE